MRCFFKNLLLLVLVLAVLEGASYVVYRVVFGKPYGQAEIAERLRQASQSPQENLNQLLAGNLIIPHPYLGFVYDSREKIAHNGIRISDYGFVDDKPPLRKRSPDTVIVGIFGGSVAWWLQSLGEAEIKKGIEKSPRFAGKKIEFVRLALGAYKQPQQLLALSYILALGGEFDIIINVDGFNEVALVNFGERNFVFFPEYWPGMIQGISGRKEIALVGKIETAKEFRSGTAAWFATSAFRESISAATVWALYDRYLGANVHRLREQLEVVSKSEAKDSPAADGPNRRFRNPQEFFRTIAATWRESSLQMERLARENGIVYFHFLQPNQYFPDSKTFQKEEAAVALNPDSAPGKNVALAYPVLREEGRILAAKGVKFFDATQIFKDVSEATYNDNCCHLSEKGNELFGKFVGESIGSAETSSPPTN